MYIKDYRASVENLDAKVFRFDSKYYYLDPSHKDSIFNTSNIAKKLKGVDVQEWQSFNSIAKGLKDSDTITAKDLAEELDVSTVAAIAMLIKSGWEFLEDEEAFCKPEEEGISYTGEEAHLYDTREHIITTCILGEPISETFVKSLRTYCKEKGAMLHIFFKLRYVKDSDDIFMAKIKLESILEGCDFKFYFKEDLLINEDLLEVKASANVHHTAIKPLSGVLALASTKYLVIPHARQELEVTVSKNWNTSSLVMSTGCINDLGKGHTQALAKAKFHGVRGALILDPKKTNGYGLTHINFDGQGFYHFKEWFAPNEYRDGNSIHSLYVADMHCSLSDPYYISKLADNVSWLKPLQVISGDVFDGQSINHHEQARTGFFAHRMTLTEEIKITTEVVRRLMGDSGAEFVCLPSNHHNFFGKFFSNPVNFKGMTKHDLATAYRALAYIVENTNHVAEGISYANPTSFLLNDLFTKSNFDVFTQPRYGFDDLALGFHGDEWGMRQSLGNQSNMKAVLGHVHRMKISKGIFWVSSCMLPNPCYQNGMNASAQGSAIVYNNGKRMMLANI